MGSCFRDSARWRSGNDEEGFHMSTVAVPVGEHAEVFELILPDTMSSTAETVENYDYFSVEPDSKITAFHGFSTFKGVAVTGEGADIEGILRGTLKSYNFKRLYQVYHLKGSESWKVWVAEFKKDTTQSQLKQVFNDEQMENIDVEMKYTIRANYLRGVSRVRVGFETIKLKLNGTEKNFTIANPASGSAKDQNGQDIPVDFKPV